MTHWMELRRTTVAVMASTALAGSFVESAAASPPEISDDWTFGATIYGWFPDISGDTSFRGETGSIDVGIDTILDSLDMTFQGAFEVQKGRWGAFTDIVYMDVGASKSRTRNLAIDGITLPASVTADLDLDLKSTFWTFAGSYRVTATPTATLDVFAGARLADIEQTLKWEFTGDFGPIQPPPRTGRADTDPSHWDGVVGVRGRYAFGADHAWSVPYYWDIGTGGSDLTWQAAVGLAYEFSWGQLGVAWRYLDYDLGSDSAVTDLDMNGPALGAKFRW